MEITQTGFLSAIASLTPYSDFNQSPRNMYQCQVRNMIKEIKGQISSSQVTVTLFSFYYSTEIFNFF